LLEVIKDIGAFAGLAAFFGLALLALLSFTQGRDIRRLREWAGSSPERDAERKESTSAAASERAEEMRNLEEGRDEERAAAELRETRRERREAGLPELTRSERLRSSLSGGRSRLAEPGFLVATFLIVVLIGGGIAYGVLHGFGGEEKGGAGKSGKQSKATKPSQIEVAVLNGTAVEGLAGSYGDMVEKGGFQLGAVTNSNTSFQESVVMYKPGNGSSAHKVASALNISGVRLMTEEIALVSAGAPIAVVIGEDNASSAG
jgi:LytR cell envelope-related transcriptional attenuator